MYTGQDDLETYSLVSALEAVCWAGKCASPDLFKENTGIKTCIPIMDHYSSNEQ